MKILEHASTETSLIAQIPGSLSSMKLPVGADALLTASAIRSRYPRGGAAILLSSESTLPISTSAGRLAGALQYIADGPVAIVQVTFSPAPDRLQPGLATIHNGELKTDPAVDHTKSGQPSITRIDSTRPEVLSLAASGALSRFFNELKNRYRFVLVEGGSLRDSAETVAIAQCCEGVILMVERGRATSGDVVNARRSAQAANLNLMGFVLEGGRDRGKRLA